MIVAREQLSAQLTGTELYFPDEQGRAHQMINLTFQRMDIDKEYKHDKIVAWEQLWHFFATKFTGWHQAMLWTELFHVVESDRTSCLSLSSSDTQSWNGGRRKHFNLNQEMQQLVNVTFMMDFLIFFFWKVSQNLILKWYCRRGCQ